MDKSPKAQVESFIWDCTVGAGIDADRAPAVPNGKVLARLSECLGRPLTDDDRRWATGHWRACIQSMLQP